MGEYQMSDTTNLPATISRFEDALDITNPRKRTSRVERIFADFDAQIQIAQRDYALVVNNVSTSRLMASDAAARRDRHARAVELAIRQGNREAAIRQARERERASAEAAHADAEAQNYAELARIQDRRLQDLRDMSANLRAGYRTMEREALKAYLRLCHQQSLEISRQQLSEIEALKAPINAMHVHADELKASHSTDPHFQIMGLGIRETSRRVEEEIDRAMRGESG
jgi:hypothetical protein